VAAYPLRTLTGADATADQIASPLFFGAALMAAVAAVWFVDRRDERGWRGPAVAAAGVIAIAGGAVIGWPQDARLPRALTADIAGARVMAEGPRAAKWAAANLPHAAPIVADAANGRLLEGAGFRRVLAGTPAVAELLSLNVISRSQWDGLRRRGVAYVLLDRRPASSDATIGYFYPRPSEAARPPLGNWRAIRRKYARLPGSERIFDSGDIVVFDIRRPLRELEEPPPDVG
jgi:hypothetical protein